MGHPHKQFRSFLLVLFFLAQPVGSLLLLGKPDAPLGFLITSALLVTYSALALSTVRTPTDIRQQSRFLSGYTIADTFAFFLAQDEASLNTTPFSGLRALVICICCCSAEQLLRSRANTSALLHLQRSARRVPSVLQLSTRRLPMRPVCIMR